MTTSQQTSFLSEILEGKEIPPGKIAYFRERLRNRLYDLVVTEFLSQQKTQQLTRADVARRIGRRPEQLTRWLGAPGNWTLDTVSDLLLAMGAEPEFSVASVVNRTASNPIRPSSPELNPRIEQPRKLPWQPDKAKVVSMEQLRKDRSQQAYPDYAEQMRKRA